MPLNLARRGVGALRHLSLSDTFSRPVCNTIAQSHARRISLAANSRSLHASGRHVSAAGVLPKTLANGYATKSTSDGAAKSTEGKRTTKVKTTTTKTIKAKKTKKSAPKKDLTEEQKEAADEKKKILKLKQLIKELKATALTPPKQLPSQPHLLAIGEKRKALERGPDESMPDVFRRAVALSRSITAEEQQKFAAQAEANRKTNATTREEWIKSHTPLQIKDANHARRRLAHLTNKKAALLHDDRLVKRPSSAYAQFLQERIRNGDFKYMSVVEIGQRTGEEWNGMTEPEKAKYRELEVADKNRYHQEYLEVYGEEPGFVTRANKAEAEA
ncbi:uncharacterized protein BDW47DRAFT_123964 [Aspergillus candidus]|uniref:HMG box domain-containing protein n=1 Tax=Aspergillus candidus TaxID=41067 RepID=A0A2I2FHC1_ASPCN|nr:hypothetical protein BDW47DRAFT_123964 [Aspergillus candidus]PLB40023.1 hypothetical protein BDW47DRAFT_123964 [Aspergillus candidus]